MIEHVVNQCGRGGGKTYRMMTEIHDLYLQSRMGEAMVVFPDHGYLHRWRAEWLRRFPMISMPAYVVISNTLNARGKMFSKLYVEDVDSYEEGIYDSRFNDLYISLSGSEEPVVYYTSRHIWQNDKPYALSERARDESFQRGQTSILQRLARIKEARESTTSRTVYGD